MRNRGARRDQSKNDHSADCSYIHDIPHDELQETEGKCLLIDPGRRDLHYGMHELSTPELPKIHRRVALTTKIILLLISRHKSLRTRHDHEAHNHPLHRKLRLSAYINQKQADARLDTVLVMGNWSAPIARFHEPIRGKGRRDIFKRHGFKVYLIDEYRTSVTCPECSNRLETFKRIPNPRPWQRIKRPGIKYHGLLRCTNLNCLKSMEFSRSRLWNRDTAAVLNFRHILLSLRTNGEILERFRHPKATAAAAAAADKKNFPALLSQD
nr:hypothetical protein BX666DRAFT_2016927 [Dichotomocladium elegans]